MDEDMLVGSSTAMKAQDESTSSHSAHLTVVELFQSQGCSSCPPTNSNIISLSQDPNFLVLTYEVTYWDYLGWKDTFGKSKFDRRQRDYASVMGNRSVYTPQVIINGAIDGVGNKPKDLQKLIESGKRSLPLQAHISQDSILITGTDYHDTALILLVKYIAKPADVCIQRGENGGRTLPHRNVVTDVCEIGRWTRDGGDMKLQEPTLEKGEEGVILIQAGTGGPIVGAAKL